MKFLKTVFAIIGGVVTGTVIFGAGSACYKNNKTYREWFDGVDDAADDIVNNLEKNLGID